MRPKHNIHNINRNRYTWWSDIPRIQPKSQCIVKIYIVNEKTNIISYHLVDNGWNGSFSNSLLQIFFQTSNSSLNGCWFGIKRARNLWRAYLLSKQNNSYILILIWKTARRHRILFLPKLFLMTSRLCLQSRIFNLKVMCIADNKWLKW